jgi:XTP/dITP diphosphohydrolase
VKARLASGNRHKLEELRRALPAWEIELASPSAGDESGPEETGATFLENARIKARFARARAPGGEWALGEDSGIEVAALGGRPGVHSARWADDGVARLLAELGGRADRRARYVCQLVAISPAGDEVNATGTLEGAIAAAPSGDEGFGYDPIFVPAGESRTVAELGNDWKRTHSHRARAAAALATALGSTGSGADGV